MPCDNVFWHWPTSSSKLAAAHNLLLAPRVRFKLCSLLIFSCKIHVLIEITVFQSSCFTLGKAEILILITFIALKGFDSPPPGTFSITVLNTFLLFVSCLCKKLVIRRVFRHRDLSNLTDGARHLFASRLFIARLIITNLCLHHWWPYAPSRLRSYHHLSNERAPFRFPRCMPRFLQRHD